MSFVSKWARDFCDINSYALKKWYVWLSGSSAGIISDKNKETKIKDKNPNPKKIKLLSNKKEFFNLIKSIFGFINFVFLNLKKAKDNKKFKIEKTKTLVSFIALNKDKTSMFKITNAKKAINTTKKLLTIEAIK